MDFKLPDPIPHPYKVVDNPEFVKLIDDMAAHRCRQDHHAPAYPCERHVRLARANLELAYEKQAEARASS